jgi:hypothetical protein
MLNFDEPTTQRIQLIHDALPLGDAGQTTFDHLAFGILLSEANSVNDIEVVLEAFAKFAAGGRHPLSGTTLIDFCIACGCLTTR